jgi:hypothetical protein
MGKAVGPFVFVSLALLNSVVIINSGQAQEAGRNTPPVIPKTWDDEAVASLEVPLAEASASPVQIPVDYYYRMSVRPVYKTYPVYAPGKEPRGYLERLSQQKPEILFDPAKLKTEADWIKAGELVFDAPTLFEPVGATEVRNPKYYEQARVPAMRDHTVPFYRYVVRKTGEVEVGSLSCAGCHTRVMSDGTVIKGAQGNFPITRDTAFLIRAEAAAAADKDQVLRQVRLGQGRRFAAPWLRPDPNARIDQMSIEEIASAFEAIPPGVVPRTNASLFSPVPVPDLIGIRDRRYLDRTGLVRHRSIGDLMRYAALAQPRGADGLRRYGDFIPEGEDLRTLPDPATYGRYSDEQLYALALYIYSLEPPPNPNRRTQLAVQGEQVFTSEGCATCHTPPLYTNNKLTPAVGFTIPDGHRTRFDIFPLSVGTDPTLTLTTRRGTGYYKVPSLKGVWYRGPFEHNGSVATLEDWFDPRRLRDDYVPTGWKGAGEKARAVRGHEFGLKLSANDKRALIAFLKTL